MSPRHEDISITNEPTFDVDKYRIATSLCSSGTMLVSNIFFWIWIWRNFSYFHSSRAASHLLRYAIVFSISLSLLRIEFCSFFWRFFCRFEGGGAGVTLDSPSLSLPSLLVCASLSSSAFALLAFFRFGFFSLLNAVWKGKVLFS